jgi:hypothetical protein
VEFLRPENMPPHYTSGYKFLREPAGYMYLIIEDTQNSLGNESAITMEPNCFGNDIIDGIMPEDKTTIEGRNWVQLIKDRIPNGVT